MYWSHVIMPLDCVLVLLYIYIHTVKLSNTPTFWRQVIANELTMKRKASPIITDKSRSKDRPVSELDCIYTHTIPHFGLHHIKQFSLCFSSVNWYTFGKILFAAIVAIAIFTAVVPAALRVHNLNKWFHLALVVVVSGCPCALILSTPVATYCALSRAATSGLLVKGAEYLETLSKIKIMAFDKTGTITRGEFVVTDFQTLSDDSDLETLLYW